MTNEEQLYKDIAPYSAEEFHEKIQHLIQEPGFEHAVKWVMPDIDYTSFCQQLLQVPDGVTFQRMIMMPFLEMLAAKTTSGLSIDGLENIDSTKAYTFITNHRDIVLDTSFLNLNFLRADYPTTEVAIGSNLLIYNWISDLVRLNKSFIVKRGLPRAKALDAARELSGYIHYAVTGKKQSVWIAEREGRSKDSNDLAQDALIKMLGLAGDKGFQDNLSELNILPISISYEYDPNDYLKAREFLLKRRDPEYKKTQHDDLFSMETGLLQPKGRVHYTVGTCITDTIKSLDSQLDRANMAREVCSIIDSQIHTGYKLFPANYIAYDLLNTTDKFALHYSADEASTFNTYVESQINKINDIGTISADERMFLRQMMFTMYANPLKNNIGVDTRCPAD